MSRWTKEEYEEYMSKKERIESINLTPSTKREVDWDDVLIDLARKAHEADNVNIILPIHSYPQLVPHTIYEVGKYIHIN